MERVIVTGATSMIGEALIEECLKHGISVCAVIRKDTARKDRLPQDPHLELVECSLEELAALPEKVTGSFDTFYHIAWGYTGAARNKSTRLQSKNIDYTLDAVEAAAKLGYVDEAAILCEMAASAYRAGVDIYMTYYAKEVAHFMDEGRIG